MLPGQGTWMGGSGADVMPGEIKRHHYRMGSLLAVF
jgi:hypothetical protein